MKSNADSKEIYWISIKEEMKDRVYDWKKICSTLLLIHIMMLNSEI